MSSSNGTTKETRYETSPEMRDALGSIRRMDIRLNQGAFWQVTGHLLLDKKKETRNAEVFGSLGFYSRPKPGANAEAIVVFVGGAANPVIIGTRDEDLRKIHDELLEQDSALMCTRATIILIRPDGSVEIRAAGGVAHPLPTLDEFNNHTHPAPGGATSAPTTPATGTTVLKAQ